MTDNSTSSVDWQPIETAPRDGTYLDVWMDGERIPDVFWGACDFTEKTQRGLPEQGWCRVLDDGWTAPVSTLTHGPSHWRHVPKGPSDV